MISFELLIATWSIWNSSSNGLGTIMPCHLRDLLELCGHYPCVEWLTDIYQSLTVPIYLFMFLLADYSPVIFINFPSFPISVLNLPLVFWHSCMEFWKCLLLVVRKIRHFLLIRNFLLRILFVRILFVLLILLFLFGGHGHWKNVHLISTTYDQCRQLGYGDWRLYYLLFFCNEQVTVLVVYNLVEGNMFLHDKQKSQHLVENRRFITCTRIYKRIVYMWNVRIMKYIFAVFVFTKKLPTY